MRRERVGRVEGTGDMSGDIRPGDLVVCVDASPHGAPHHANIKEGRHYRVSRIFHHHAYPQLLVGLHGVAVGNSTGGLSHFRFRKLNDEPDNAELIERIRQCRPVKQGEMA